MAGTPHYLREYRNMLNHLRQKYADDDTPYEKAVGGDYKEQGQRQAGLVLNHAPDGPFSLLDIGCGSGRAATALRDQERLSYFGVDILPELLEYAQKKAQRPDWRFMAIEEIALPVEDNWADITLIMSVFTHLKPAEIKQYIAEIYRAAKPGGRVICSYLDRTFEPHVSAFRPKPVQLIGRLVGRDVMLTFTTCDELAGWFEDAGFKFEKIANPEQSDQHVMICRKPLGATV